MESIPLAGGRIEKTRPSTEVIQNREYLFYSIYKNERIHNSLPFRCVVGNSRPKFFPPFLINTL